MVSEINKTLCTGCGVCESVCPVKCIKMKRDSAGFLYPDIDDASCIKCNKCDMMCHAINKTSKKIDNPIAYIAYNKNEDERMSSSSGGVFAAIAQTIFSMGGIVYGAAFDDNLAVNHVRIENEEDIDRLQGSKYVQSTICSDIYVSVKNDLINGKYVLYSGTPCQIGALKSYLGNEYENLYTVSFICHGVPAPFLWHQYCEWQKQRHNSNIVKASHRSKEHGWVQFSMKLLFSNGEIYIKRKTDDPYLQLFLKNTCLRSSCHSCQYKGLENLSCVDIMLADKWGTVSGNLPNMKDDKGISLVFLQSSKGMLLWDKFKGYLSFDRTNFKEAIISNQSYNLSSNASPNREKVLSGINNMEILDLYKKYAKTSFRVRFKMQSRKVLYTCAKYCGIVWLVKRVKTNRKCE